MFQRLRPPLVAVVCLLSAPAPLHAAETWQTGHGETFEGTLTAVYGPLVALSGKTQNRLVPLENLDASGLERVADHLASLPAQPPRWGESESVVAKSLRKRLQVWDDAKGKLVEFDPGERPEPEIYLVYFSAHWCGPCRRFTPKLIEAYHELKSNPAYARVFELVFVSNDHSSAEQATYVRENGMPWPLLKFSQLGRVKPLERWEGNGIPCLVAVTKTGELLYHSYRGSEYLGPDHVLTRFRELLPLLDPAAPVSRRSRHKLAVLQHVRAAADGRHPPKAYVLHLNSANYQRLPVNAFKALLTIDPAGRVSDVSTEPALGAVYEAQFRRDSAEWLFLPAVQNGQPVSARVEVPVKL